MKKPTNYDTTKAGGDYTPVTPGGHHLIIKKVEETKSKVGKDMIKVYFDMAANDTQPEYCMNEFKNDVRPDKKWPRVGTAYIVTEDSEGNCSRSFKTFTTSFERSNNCEMKWDGVWGDQFINKKIGGVFGRVENEYNGTRTMRTEMRWFCSDDKVEEATVPAEKKLDSVVTPNDGFMNIPANSNEMVPWGN